MRKITGIAALLAVCAASLCAHAQDAFPNKPIRVVIPFAPGSTLDVVGNLTAQRLEQALGQKFIVEYMGGGNGVVGAQAVSRAAAVGSGSSSDHSRSSRARSRRSCSWRFSRPTSPTTGSSSPRVVSEWVAVRSHRLGISDRSSSPGVSPSSSSPTSRTSGRVSSSSVSSPRCST